MAIDQASVDMVCDELFRGKPRLHRAHDEPPWPAPRLVREAELSGIGHDRVLINPTSGRRVTVHEAVENLTPRKLREQRGYPQMAPHLRGSAPQDLREGYQFVSSLEVMISVGYTGVAVQE